MAARGWYVFPVKARDKVPATRHGFKDATNDLEQLTATFAGRDYNVGIACGPSGLVVVDIDDGALFDAWRAERELPATFTVATGKGRHLYYAAGSLVVKSTQHPVRGFDVRAQGGYVVGPGSTHPNGHHYEVMCGRDPAPLPRWLATELHTTATGDGWTRPDVNALATAGIPAGRPQDPALRDLVWKLRADGFTEAAALAVWQTVVDKTTLTRPDEPWTVADFQRHWRGAVTKITGASTVEPPATTPNEPTPSAWASLDLAAVLDGDARPEMPTLMLRTDGAGLLYPGRVHSIHGESESGKSWVALAEAAYQLNAGGSVLILDYESDPGSITRRLFALGADAEAIRYRLDYRQPEGPPESDPAAFTAMLGRRFTLAVIDGVTEALAEFGANSKDNDDVTRWSKSVPRRIADTTGAAVVLIDHVTKATDGRGRFAIGAQAKMAALTGAAFSIDVAEALAPGKVGVLHLRVGKDRPGMVRARAGAWRKADRTQLAAVFTMDARDPEHLCATIDPPDDAHQPAAAFRPTTLMERVSLALEASPEPLTTREILDRVAGKQEYVRVAIGILKAEGFIRTEPGPRNAIFHSLVKTYRQAEDEQDTLDPPSDRIHGRDRVPPLGSGHGTQSLDRIPDTVGTQSGHGQTQRAELAGNRSGSAAVPTPKKCADPGCDHMARNGCWTCWTHSGHEFDHRPKDVA